MDLSLEQVDYLLTEANSLAFTIQHLSERRVAILREINAVRSSTRALPTETLSEIIKFACPNPDDDRIADRPGRWNLCPRGALNFSHVSSRWRNVAFSIPQLWKRMRIDIHVYLNVQRSADILALHFQNAGALPFSLYFSSPDKNFEVGPISDVLFQEEHSRKVESLTLRPYCPRGWLPLISHNFPRLKTLICEDELSPRKKPIFKLDPSTPTITAPNLTSITLTYCPVTVESSWEKITTLQLKCMPICTCARLIYRCPNLVNLRCSDLSQPFELFEDPLIESTITTVHTFPHLTTITWAYSPTAWHDAIINNTHLPALQTLQWGCMLPADEATIFIPIFIPIFTTFITRVSETLLELELGGATNWSERQFQQLLSPLKHLRKITYVKGDGNTVTNLLAALRGPSSNGHRNLLPLLTNLTIGHYRDSGDGRASWNTLGWLSPPVVQTLQSRLANAEEKFTLDMRIDWTVEVEKQIREMIESGAKLEVLDSEKRDLDMLIDKMFIFS